MLAPWKKISDKPRAHIKKQRHYFADKGLYSQSYGIVSKAEINAFWNSVAFLMVQWILAIWSLVPLPFLKPTWTSLSVFSGTKAKSLLMKCKIMRKEAKCIILWLILSVTDKTK